MRGMQHATVPCHSAQSVRSVLPFCHAAGWQSYTPASLSPSVTPPPPGDAGRGLALPRVPRARRMSGGSSGGNKLFIFKSSLRSSLNGPLFLSLHPPSLCLGVLAGGVCVLWCVSIPHFPLWLGCPWVKTLQAHLNTKCPAKSAANIAKAICLQGSAAPRLGGRARAVGCVCACLYILAVHARARLWWHRLQRQRRAGCFEGGARPQAGQGAVIESRERREKGWERRGERAARCVTHKRTPACVAHAGRTHTHSAQEGGGGACKGKSTTGKKRREQGNTVIRFDVNGGGAVRLSARRRAGARGSHATRQTTPPDHAARSPDHQITWCAAAACPRSSS